MDNLHPTVVPDIPLGASEAFSYDFPYERMEIKIKVAASNVAASANIYSVHGGNTLPSASLGQASTLGANNERTLSLHKDPTLATSVNVAKYWIVVENLGFHPFNVTITTKWVLRLWTREKNRGDSTCLAIRVGRHYNAVRCNATRYDAMQCDAM